MALEKVSNILQEAEKRNTSAIAFEHLIIRQYIAVLWERRL